MNQKLSHSGMDVTKPYEFIGFRAIDVTKPYEFLRFGAMDVTKPYEFIGFGAPPDARYMDRSPDSPTCSG